MKSTLMQIPARKITVGDLIFHQDYPVEVLEVQKDTAGQVLIVWGPDEVDRAVVLETAMVAVSITVPDEAPRSRTKRPPVDINREKP